MNNAPVITNASFPPSPAEIEPSRYRIPIRQITNCLCLPETLAASAGAIMLTAGGLTLGFASIPALAGSLLAGGTILLYGSVIYAVKCHNNPSSSSEDLENHLDPIADSNLDPVSTPIQANSRNLYFELARLPPYSSKPTYSPPEYTEENLSPPPYTSPVLSPPPLPLLPPPSLLLLPSLPD